MAASQFIRGLPNRGTGTDPLAACCLGHAGLICFEERFPGASHWQRSRTQYGMKRVRPLRCLGTIATVLSLSVATAYSQAAAAREADVPFQAIVPNDWTLLPRAPDSLGRRFVSPSGDAWLWYFAVPVNAQGQPPTPRGQVTYTARGGDWIVTSGYRGERIFYRRAMLACNGTKWRHIEFEYPASEKRHFDSFVTRTSYALRAYKEAGC
jgi:hypothetical protein